MRKTERSHFEGSRASESLLPMPTSAPLSFQPGVEPVHIGSALLCIRVGDGAQVIDVPLHRGHRLLDLAERLVSRAEVPARHRLGLSIADLSRYRQLLLV